MSLLKLNIIKNKRVYESLKLESKLDKEDDIEYKLKIIKDSAIYATDTTGLLQGLYYLLS